MERFGGEKKGATREADISSEGSAGVLSHGVTLFLQEEGESSPLLFGRLAKP